MYIISRNTHKTEWQILVEKEMIRQKYWKDANKKKGGVAIFLSEKAEFRVQNIHHSKERHYQCSSDLFCLSPFSAPGWQLVIFSS